MQSSHSYPTRRNQWPTMWHARAGATVEDAPLAPKTADRTRAIRTIFLQDFNGYASIHDVLDRCDELGLLATLTDRTAHETVMRALRPVGTRNRWESARAAPVSPPSPLG